MKTNLKKTDLISQANARMGASNFTVLTQTESSIVFQGGKDINWFLFVLLLCLVVVGAIIYYVVSKNSQVIVNWSQTNGALEVTASGNTKKAQAVASSFLNSLPKA
jgi:uncharacterized membrane protein YagU involved in acid resistance